jgi:acetyl esterase/lipase
MKMQIEDVAPDLWDALKAMPTLPLRSRLFRAVSPLLMSLRPAPRLEGVKRVKPRGGAPGLRLFVPERRKSNAALLWIHGGGYVIGVAKLDDALCAQVCRELGIVVASAEYRLAPRHPFPAPLDDCHAVWRWMLENAGDLGIEPARIAIGGMSAGGGLAAGLVQRVHDEEGPDAAAQWLLAPMLDDRTAARRELDEIGHLIWDNSLNHFGWSSYLDMEPGAPKVPDYAAPARRENLQGLPPAWIGFGSIELFRQEDESYAERLKSAGCDVRVEIVEGAPHGFEAWGAQTGIGREYLQKARNWLADRLA